MVKLRVGVALFAGCMATLVTAAPPPVSLATAVAKIERALAEHNLTAAGEMLEELVEVRLPAKAGRPDPLLDRLYVDLFVAAGHLPAAMPMLRRVVSDQTVPNHSHYALLVATDKEAAGAFDEAEQQYRALTGDPKTAEEARRGALL